jgi:enoyl-CoA hydratase
MTTSCRFTMEEGIGTLSLEPSNPTRPPTFDHTSLDAFDVALATAEEATSAGTLRILFVRSASPRFLCAGANIAALGTLNEHSIGAWVAHGHRVFNRLARLPVPTVARIEGYALGGGLELGLACDLIFASDAAQLGQTEASLGFVAGWGASIRLARRVGVSRAADLFFSARMVSAVDAARIGLVDFVGSTEELAVHCATFASAVIRGSDHSHREHKFLLSLVSHATIEDQGAAEATASVACLRSTDTQNRVRAFLNRRK